MVQSRITSVGVAPGTLTLRLGQSEVASLSPDAAAVVAALYDVRDSYARSTRWGRVSAVAITALAVLGVGGAVFEGIRHWRRRG